jgi:thioesterase domain-containing protein
VYLGGESLSEQVVNKSLSLLPHLELWNLYGPTEASITTTAIRLSPHEEVTIGKPLPNYQVYILDSNLQPVPIGVFGELHISGTGLARGYLNQPSLTAQKFIPNPFSELPGDRLYKTGDLVRYHPDGNIEYRGRIDHQVKIRGYRIELGEIEAVLSQFPGVNEAVAIVKDFKPDDQRIIAYIHQDQESRLYSKELREFLKTKLPEYMIPSVFILLESLPLTPNGKVDRIALQDLEHYRPEHDTEIIKPRSQVEKQLGEIWEDVLGFGEIGIYDNFFELGGHSLLAVRVLAEIEKVFFQRLSLISFFQSPTIKHLASKLDGNKDAAINAKRSIVAIQPYGSKRPLYCIPGILGNVYTDLGALSEHLGPDQPFYGFQDGVHNPSKIESMAETYINEMRDVQPQGPYNLAGICSGAVVAYEMAYQLERKGEKVSFLAIVEPSPIRIPGLQTYRDFFVYIIRRVLKRTPFQAQKISKLDLDQRFAYVRLKIKQLANSLALRRYKPKKYPDHVHLFLTEESMQRQNKPPMGWIKWIQGGTEVHQIPGTHNTITGAEDTPIESNPMKILADQFVQINNQIN